MPAKTPSYAKRLSAKLCGEGRVEDPAGTCAGQLKSVNLFLRDTRFALLVLNKPILKDHSAECGAGDLIIAFYAPKRFTHANGRARDCNIALHL